MVIAEGTCGLDGRASNFPVTVSGRDVKEALVTIERKYPGRNASDVIAVRFCDPGSDFRNEPWYILGDTVCTPREAVEDYGKDPNIIHHAGLHGWKHVAITAHGIFPFRLGKDVLYVQPQPFSSRKYDEPELARAGLGHA